MRAREFDFETRTEQAWPASEPPRAGADGRFYVWYDLDVAVDPTSLAATLNALGRKLEDVPSLRRSPAEVEYSYRVLPNGLTLSIAAPVTGNDGSRLETCPVGLILGERYAATVHEGSVAFLEEVWRSCPEDFRQFAQSPGFLLYEFWDHLIAEYRRAADRLGEQVLRAQNDAFGSGDEIFEHVAALSRDLLTLRRTMVAAREVLSELATRRSPVVAASTMPFLQTLVAALDRLVADLAVEREILAETLNLYIGLVGHRTNQVVNRLTILSFVFLPLTFLCGVYGMNFRVLPELEWRYGYLTFWIVAALIVATTLTYMRRRGWW